MNSTHDLSSMLRSRSAPASIAIAIALLIFVTFAAAPAFAQPPLTLPAGALPPCPTSGSITGPCMTVTPTLYPAYFNVTFKGLPSGYNISNGTYLGWCADLYGDFNPSQSYVLYSSYSTLPPGLISNWGAVNWLLNHKPLFITDDNGKIVLDPRTIRDAIQQTIWELLDGGPLAHYCCSVDFTDPSSPFYYKPQYNGSIGGGNNLPSGKPIVNAINKLYSQAVGQSGFVPASGQVMAVVLRSDGSLASSGNPYQDNLIEICVPSQPHVPCITVTQGGWGAPAHGDNPAATLAKYFTKVYPLGKVVIGGNYTLTFTSAAAIEAFLPAKGTAKPLTASFVNPTNSYIAGEFAGQVLAAQLNVDFSNAGIFKTGLGAITMPKWGKLGGWTVNAVLAAANTVLGGGALPPGVSLSDLNCLLDYINGLCDCGTNDLNLWNYGHDDNNWNWNWGWNWSWH